MLFSGAGVKAVVSELSIAEARVLGCITQIAKKIVLLAALREVATV